MTAGSGSFRRAAAGGKQGRFLVLPESSGRALWAFVLSLAFTGAADETCQAIAAAIEAVKQAIS